MSLYFSSFFGFLVFRQVQCNIMGRAQGAYGRGDVLDSKDTNQFHAFKLIYNVASF